MIGWGGDKQALYIKSANDEYPEPYWLQLDYYKDRYNEYE